MKRIVILLFVSVVAILVAKDWGLQQEKVGSLFLDNVEALANDEVVGKHWCVGSGVVDCPRLHTKVEVVYSGYSLDE